MVIAVTGASGHIGGNLVRALLAGGAAVRCLVHAHTRGIDGLDVATVSGDLLDPDSLRRAFEGAETVYHLAARTSLVRRDIPEMEAVNVTGTRNVVAACLQAGVRQLVHFGSIHCLEQRPYDEVMDEDRPLSLSPDAPAYDRSKARGLLEVQKGLEQGLDAVTVLPTGVLGPHDYEPSYFGRVIVRLAAGNLPALTAGGFDWVDVRDVVAGTLAAAEKAPSGSTYLLSGHWKSVTEIARAVHELTGSRVPPRMPPGLAAAAAPLLEAWGRLTGTQPLYTRMSLGALRSSRHVSHERATRELGYASRPFRDTLADTLAWFRERNG